MTPDQIAKGNSEHAHQTALYAWAALNRSQYPELEFLFAIPNGGKRDVITAANMKAEGLRAGVPDNFLPAPVGMWHGLYIEMKRPKDKGKAAGQTSDEQEHWIAYLRSKNYGVVIAYTWIEAKDHIIAYLNWEKEHA